MTIQRLENIEK